MATLAEMEAELAALEAQGSAPVVEPTLEEMEAELASLERAGEISQGESALAGAAKGVSLGFVDELQAALAAGLIHWNDLAPEEQSLLDTYNKERDVARGQLAEAEIANPKTFGAAEIGGTMLPAVLTGGATTAREATLKAGALGATMGAGEAEEMSDVPMEAAKTGTLTAGGGLLLNKLGAPLASRSQTLANKAYDAALKPGPAPTTLSGLLNISGKDVLPGLLGFAGGGPWGALTGVGLSKAFRTGLGKALPTEGPKAANRYAKWSDRYAKWAEKTQKWNPALPITLGEFMKEEPKLLTQILQDKADDSTSP